MTTKNKLVEGIGWLSVVLILVAYGLVSFDMMDAKSLTYQLMNLFGAVGIIASSLDNKDWQPIVLNAVWASIAVVSISISL